MDELKNKPRDGALFLDQPAAQEDPAQFAGDGKAEEAAEILEELINLMDLDVQVEIRSDAERIELNATGEDIAGNRCESSSRRTDESNR